MASRTELERAVRALDADAVTAALDASPVLLDHRDPRGRSWLHRCAAVDVSGRPDDVAGSVAIADDLLARGLGIDDAAFVEDDGRWRATPLWYAVARGRNHGLAEHLLELGCDPNHSLFAAAFNRDVAMIDLLLAHGADLDPVVEDETPFLGAIKVSHFAEAWRLAEHGADVDHVDETGSTALHHMLRKSSPTEHLLAFAAFRPCIDLPDRNGTTARELLARTRDPALRELATTLA